MMSTPPVARRKSGFTLIELLVVIAIIAILAAILFPVFARARENARRASCQSNQKNILLGFKQYIQDYDELYPRAMNGAITNTSATSANPSVPGELDPYIKSKQIWQCPSDSLATGPTFMSYGYNWNLAGGVADGSKAGVNESQMNNSAVIILLAEIKGHATAPVLDPPTDTASGALTSSRHLEGANYGFVDGHVKWLKPGKMSTSTDGTPTYTVF